MLSSTGESGKLLCGQLAGLIKSFTKTNESTEDPNPPKSKLPTQDAGSWGKKDWNGAKMLQIRVLRKKNNKQTEPNQTTAM